MPSRRADDEPAERFLERVPAGAARACARLSQSVLRDRAGPRQQELLHVERGIEPLPEREPTTRTTPPAPSRATLPRERAAYPGATTGRSRWRLLAPAGVLAALPQELAHLGHELEEARLLARLDACAAAAGRSATMPAIRPGRGRHHDDARREEHRLGDRVGDEDDRRAASPARSGAAPCSAARASSRRARRTARPSAGAPGRTRARGRSRRAAASRPRAATDSGRRSRRARPARASPATRCCALRAGPSRASRAAARCSSRRCASRRARRPGRRSRSRGRAAPGARSCRSRSTAPARRLDEVADHAQQRRLAAARRADQRDELARVDVEVDAPAAR